MVFPSGSVTHLPPADLAAAGELGVMARLEEAGVALGVVVLPSAIEDAFYRLNNLPPRLARLYQGLDPRDPDEDIVEEAEQAAVALLSGSYLLDDLIDAIYASLAALPEVVEVRRPGARGSAVTGPRAALLAVKRIFTDDWTTEAVLSRLSVTGRLGIEARPVIVHAAAPVAVAPTAVTSQVHAVVGGDVRFAVDEVGRVIRVHGAGASS
ncbi:MAG TPA: hypothetical protein VKZ43_02590 [Trueperaceae bacterium]|nr:hypothetical protein [Trueperaceae bacterium]